MLNTTRLAATALEPSGEPMPRVRSWTPGSIAVPTPMITAVTATSPSPADRPVATVTGTPAFNAKMRRRS